MSNAGFVPTKIQAYPTRVSSGPFPEETQAREVVANISEYIAHRYNGSGHEDAIKQCKPKTKK